MRPSWTSSTPVLSKGYIPRFLLLLNKLAKLHFCKVAQNTTFLYSSWELLLQRPLQTAGQRKITNVLMSKGGRRWFDLTRLSLLWFIAACGIILDRAKIYNLTAAKKDYTFIRNKLDQRTPVLISDWIIRKTRRIWRRRRRVGQLSQSMLAGWYEQKRHRWCQSI